MLFNNSAERIPRNDAIHFFKKDLATRLLAKAFKPRSGK
jgi:hypothetical protein